jgi:hypothetical protein
MVIVMDGGAGAAGIVQAEARAQLGGAVWARGAGIAAKRKTRRWRRLAR